MVTILSKERKKERKERRKERKENKKSTQYINIWKIQNRA